jgi:hypothetical protein
MPSTSTRALFGGGATGVSNAQAMIVIRPNGSTSDSTRTTGIYGHSDVVGSTGNIAGEITSLTDASQQMEYFTYGSTIAIVLKEYWLNIR